MAFGKKNENVLPLTIVVPAPLTSEQFRVACNISDVLWLVRKEIWNKRQAVYEKHLERLYVLRREAKAAKEEGVAELFTRYIRFLSEVYMPKLDEEINALTERRANDPEFTKVPRNWVEQAIIGAFAEHGSFMALRAKGDPDARPPKGRSSYDFCEITGRFGFNKSTVKKEQVIELLPGELAGNIDFRFPLPSGKENLQHRGKQSRLGYQKHMLARPDVVIKSFNFYRDKPDLREVGRFWISITFEIGKPELVPFVPEEAVYVALGTSLHGAFCGIVSPKGEEVLELGRPDVHWKIRADDLKEAVNRCKPGSPLWQVRVRAWQKKNRKMKFKQKQDEREAVSHKRIIRNPVPRELLAHGVHLVVLEYPPIRSKPNRLADKKKPEQRGQLGDNWQYQNTGKYHRLLAQIEQKAKERGGSVIKHKLPKVLPPDRRDHMIPLANKLRGHFLTSYYEQQKAG